MAALEERMNKDGTVTYRVKIRRKGYRTLSKTFKHKTHAKKLIHKVVLPHLKIILLSNVIQFIKAVMLHAVLLNNTLILTNLIEYWNCAILTVCSMRQRMLGLSY